MQGKGEKKLDWMPKGEPQSSLKVSERTVISLHVVILLIGLVTWVVRLSDKVEVIEKIESDREIRRKIADRLHANHELRLYRLEERSRLKHITNQEGE